MATPKRATVYLESKIHKALKLKAVETDTSLSELVNEAVRSFLSEDAEDLIAFEERKSEPASDFDTFVKQLKRDGKI